MVMQPKIKSREETERSKCFVGKIPEQNCCIRTQRVLLILFSVFFFFGFCRTAHYVLSPFSLHLFSGTFPLVLFANMLYFVVGVVMLQFVCMHFILFTMSMSCCFCCSDGESQAVEKGKERMCSASAHGCKMITFKCVCLLPDMFLAQLR